MIDEEIIQKYLGIPYKHLGRDPKDGLDCYGLIVCIYRDLGVELIDFDKYMPEWSRSGDNYFAENYHHQWEEVEIPRLFDVVLFQNKEGIANHAGLFLYGGRFIHGCKAGVVISRDIGMPVVGYYRFKHDKN